MCEDLASTFLKFVRVAYDLPGNRSATVKDAICLYD